MTEKKNTASGEASKGAEVFFAVSDLQRALDNALELAGATGEHREAARRVVGAVGAGILTGYAGHTIALSERLSTARLKADWAQRCAWHWRHLTDAQLDDETRERLVQGLCSVSHFESAKNLTPDHVDRALSTTKTPTGFAARLACDCGAFGYTDQEKAYRAFSKFKVEK